MHVLDEKEKLHLVRKELDDLELQLRTWAKGCTDVGLGILSSQFDRAGNWVHTIIQLLPKE